MRRPWFPIMAAVMGVAAALIAGSCGGASGAPSSGQPLGGIVSIDGSGTVFPISEAIAEEFRWEQRRVRVTVGNSGTGAGFQRFARGEIDVADASRPMKDAEKLMAARNGVDFIELTVALDGLAVIVNPNNTWVDYLTVEELRNIWGPDSLVKRWNQVRPHWPDRQIHLFGPTTAHGTFDYFTEAINGKSGASRTDYSASADYNVEVVGVSSDRDALGYLGFAYYAGNRSRLKVVPIDSGDGIPVAISETTINDGTYKPLSRPLFIYVNTKSLKENPEVAAFIRFYLEIVPELVSDVGYIAAPQELYLQQMEKVEKALGG